MNSLLDRLGNRLASPESCFFGPLGHYMWITSDEIALTVVFWFRVRVDLVGNSREAVSFFPQPNFPKT
jgi:hypothetical protein